MVGLIALEADPIHNPELTDEQRDALAALPREARIALSEAIAASILAQIDAWIERSRQSAA